MLTTENNKFCIRILEKCLNAAKKYSIIGNPYWLRVLQFLKYLNKDNKEVPNCNLCYFFENA